MNIIDIAQHGIAAPDAALATVRVASGMFFAASGYNKLFNRERHASILATLKNDRVPFVGVMQWWVPTCEFLGGICLTAGFMTSVVSAVLAFLLGVALKCEGRKRVAEYKPINAVDRVDDWLYLPECTYLIVLWALALVGGGAYSIDSIM